MIRLRTLVVFLLACLLFTRRKIEALRCRSGVTIPGSGKRHFASSHRLSLVDVSISDIVTSSIKVGTSGASAAGVQVFTLMWLRTALNYQYKYGGTTLEAIKTLYAQGGIPRLYQGLPFALMQGPLSRFGDTASNSLATILFLSLDPSISSSVPLPVQTALGSVFAGVWRICLMPIDTAKTVLQVSGAKGLSQLQARIEKKGPQTLFAGSIAASAATFVGHYPWFLTFNFLSKSLPTYAELVEASADASSSSMTTATTTATATAITAVTTSANSFNIDWTHTDPVLFGLVRAALIGLVASSVSDVCSNSLRVLKTTRQTYDNDNDGSSSSSIDNNDSYFATAKQIVATEGLQGLLFRGLGTRLLANALQGSLFSVLFKYFQSADR